jgi:hypothetical protein
VQNKAKIAANLTFTPIPEVFTYIGRLAFIPPPWPKLRLLGIGMLTETQPSPEHLLLNSKERSGVSSTPRKDGHFTPKIPAATFFPDFPLV